VRWLRPLMVLVPLLAIGASGCTTVTETTGLQPGSSGYVSGTASPCGLGGPDKLVEVRLSQGSRVVAVETVTGGHRFSFSEPAGWYVLSSDQSEVKPVRVQLVSGLSAVVNLPSSCY
jgi:hypothetical protein